MRLIEECKNCGTTIIYKEEDILESRIFRRIFGGDKIKIIKCPKCGKYTVLEIIGKRGTS